LSRGAYVAGGFCIGSTDGRSGSQTLTALGVKGAARIAPGWDLLRKVKD
jgi:hypothetical protein